MKEIIKKHFINFRGSRVSGKVIVFESDDWGSIRIPNNNVKQQLLNKAYIRSNDPFSMYDCLESEDDLSSLFAVFENYTDKNGNNPTMTMNMVMGNPNFDEMRKNDILKYEWEPFYSTYLKYYPNQNVFSKLKNGINNKYVYPQFHAKEHLNVQKWMDKLNSNNSKYLEAFYLDCFAVDDDSELNERSNLMATYDFHSKLELDEIKKNIKYGLDEFENIFGYKSTTSIAPCYVWNDQIEEIFNQNGIVGIQSSYIQQKNNLGKLNRVWRKMGMKNFRGQNYLIRNVLFEPSLNTNFNWVKKAIESIEIAFMWGKPAVIGSHRINYVAGLSSYNRNNSLEQMHDLLNEIQRKWPDAEFLNSAELIDRYRNV